MLHTYRWDLDVFISNACLLNRELAEMLGQVKPPTVSKEEIEKSGLEICKPAALEEYEKAGRVASNCLERVSLFYTPAQCVSLTSMSFTSVLSA